MIIKIHIEDDHFLCTKRVEVAVQDGEVLKRLSQVVTCDFLPEEVVRKRVIDKLNELVTEEITNYVNKTF